MGDDVGQFTAVSVSFSFAPPGIDEQEILNHWKMNKYLTYLFFKTILFSISKQVVYFLSSLYISLLGYQKKREGKSGRCVDFGGMHNRRC